MNSFEGSVYELCARQTDLHEQSRPHHLESCNPGTLAKGCSRALRGARYHESPFALRTSLILVGVFKLPVVIYGNF